MANRITLSAGADAKAQFVLLEVVKAAGDKLLPQSPSKIAAIKVATFLTTLHQELGLYYDGKAGTTDSED